MAEPEVVKLDLQRLALTLGQQLIRINQLQAELDALKAELVARTTGGT